MRFNLNKLFPFLSIRTKLIVAFSMLSFIPLLIVGSIGIFYTMNTMRNFAIANLSHDVSVIDERAKNFLSDINEDITYLSDSPVFRNFLQTQSASITVGGNNQVKELMLHQFLAFIKTKPMYYQRSEEHTSELQSH